MARKLTLFVEMIQMLLDMNGDLKTTAFDHLDRTAFRLLAMLITLNCVHAPSTESSRDRIRFEDDVEILPKQYDAQRQDAGRRPQTFPFLPAPPPPQPEADWRSGRVAFSAIRAHPVSRSCPRGTCDVLFENVVTATERSYDSFSAISPSYASFRVALVKNEREVLSAYGSAKGFDTAGNSIILPLLQGDKICLRLLEGELYESPLSYRAYTSFGGFLLQDFGAESQGPKFPDREPFDGTGGKPEPGPRSLPTVGANDTLQLND